MFFLAIRQLVSRKRQTILTTLGIVLGTAAYVAISGIMLGFQSFIVEQLLNNDSHIRISSKEKPIFAHSLDSDFFSEKESVNWLSPPSGRKDNAKIEHPQGWFERLDHDSHVVAYSPQLSIQAIVRRGKVVQGARLMGSDVFIQEKVTNIKDYMIEGKFQDIGYSGNKIIVGDGFLTKMGARVSETVYISSGKGMPVPFKIVGAFRLGIKTLDEGMMFGALGDVQKVNQTPSQISDIAIKLSDVSLAGELANSWASISQDKVQSWDQANANFMSIFRTQDIVRNSMTVSITIVACFGIYNILNMLVNQKKREIAILRSIGYESKDIQKLFLIQGIILGILGGVFGMLIGYIACRYFGTIKATEGTLSGKGGYMLVSYDIVIYLKAFSLAFASSTIASFLPARAAGKFTPIDIIRSEG